MIDEPVGFPSYSPCSWHTDVRQSLLNELLHRAFERNIQTQLGTRFY